VKKTNGVLVGQNNAKRVKMLNN